MTTYHDMTIELDTNEDGQEIVTNVYQCSFTIEACEDYVSGSCDLIEVWKNGVRVLLSEIPSDDIEFFETTAWNRYMEGAL